MKNRLRIKAFFVGCALLSAVSADASITLFFKDDRDSREQLFRGRANSRLRKEAKSPFYWYHVRFNRVADFEAAVTKLSQAQISEVFGSPLTAKPDNLVRPVIGWFAVGLSGIRSLDETQNHDHVDWHLMGESGVLQIYYNTDGVTPAATLFYFVADTQTLPPLYDWSGLKGRFMFEDKVWRKVNSSIQKVNAAKIQATPNNLAD